MKKAVQLIFIREGRVLAVTRKPDHKKWGFPGGMVEENESLLKAIKREVFEETNSKLSEPKIIHQEIYDNKYQYAFSGKCIPNVGGYIPGKNEDKRMKVKFLSIDYFLKNSEFLEYNKRAIDKINKINILNPKVFCFTGASGTGKSTLLNYIKDSFDINVKELSGREFLPKDNSYDKTLTNNIQILISQNRFISFIDAFLNSKDNYHVFSRGPIDNLAYQTVLKKGLVLDSIIKREIEVFRNHLLYLYLPIEFRMKDKNDIIRGQNEEIQKRVDDIIIKYLIINNLPFITISGNIEERIEQINSVFLSVIIN